MTAKLLAPAGAALPLALAGLLLAAGCVEVSRSEEDPDGIGIQTDAVSDPDSGRGRVIGPEPEPEAVPDTKVDIKPIGEIAEPTADSDTTPEPEEVAEPEPACTKDCTALQESLKDCQLAVLDAGPCECIVEDAPDHAPCSDGNACTSEDQCEDGFCQGLLVPESILCDDDNPCTLDKCDESEGCASLPVPVDCEDGDPCTLGEVCDKGVCQPFTQLKTECTNCTGGVEDSCEAAAGDGDKCNGVLLCVEGNCKLDQDSVVECEGGGPCSEVVCEPSTGECKINEAPLGTDCSDGSVCTVIDSCVAGICVGAIQDTEACSCEVDEDCAELDDDDLCNGRVLCTDGTCLFDPDSVVTCADEDDNPCAGPVCDPELGECVSTPSEDGSECDDENPCTLNDACAEGECAFTDELDCSPLDNACTLGVCTDEGGCATMYLPDGEPCESEDVCTVEAACFDGDCEATLEVVCDDGDDCTFDICLTDGPGGGGCTHSGPPKPDDCPNAGICEDKLPLCTGDIYTCDPSKVDGYKPVEECNDLDDDCDGETDELCVDPGDSGCLVGTLVKDFQSGLHACKVPAPGEGYSGLACAGGWHVCTYSQLAERAGGAAIPQGFALAAALSFDPGEGEEGSEGHWSVADVDDGLCVDMEGECGGARTLQAKTAPGLEGIPYVTEAWGCKAGKPTASCETMVFNGVMCCQDACAGVVDCPDAEACHVASCHEVIAECSAAALEEPECPSKGVCAQGVPITCLEGEGEGPDAFGCDLDQVFGYEPVEVSCDGLDNDCDGLTDVADPDLADHLPDCEKQEGLCIGASKTLSHCSDGAWQPCEAADYLVHHPDYADGAEALCDGVDDNCDGNADESFALKGKGIGGVCVSPGECGEGEVLCAAGGEGAICSTHPSVKGSPVSDEVCNGLDDDCDGFTDELADLSYLDADCPKEGVCANMGATCTPEGWICNFDALEGYEAEEATCDGLDNDCDGSEDEGFLLDVPGEDPVALGETCGPDGCLGEVLCAPAGDVAVCSAGESDDDEVCDNLDNDCNGETDEGLAWEHPTTGEAIPKGEVCTGLGVCAETPGIVECGAGSQTNCSTAFKGSQSAAGPEICNQADDDCDGIVDEGQSWEGLVVGAFCNGYGECGEGTVVCGSAGAATCSTNPDGPDYAPQIEDCDNRDDDCDGQTDEPEELDPSDAECTLTGVCTEQNVAIACEGGTWSCDYSGAIPAGYQQGDEVGRCDGLDNDCDGETDEDFVGLGDACDGPDEDECEGGTWICSEDGEGLTCSSDVAVVETCNGEDDDCDGLTDEQGAVGCSPWFLDADQDGVGAEGVPAHCLCGPDEEAKLTAVEAGDCADDDDAVFPGAGERCNGLDDDCDELVDAEDALDLLATDGEGCAKTEGVCAGASKPVSLCEDGHWIACDTATYEEHSDGAYEAGGEASCDGLDNDCDGLSDGEDSDLAAQAPHCAKQSGVCAGSKKATCSEGGWVACGDAVYQQHSELYEAGEEASCDGVDNDCDGTPDDPFEYSGKAVGQNCDGIGQCGPGQVECTTSGTAATCSTNPNGSQPEVESEVCNGADDDCDGASDEGLGLDDSPCFQIGVCSPEYVEASCAGGQWSCDYDAVPLYEEGTEASCDGLDNDCNGEADEDFVLSLDGEELVKGDACGDGACQGAVVCKEDHSGLVCTLELSGAEEVCDDADNDCDGQTDEGLAYLDPVTGASSLKGQTCQGRGECGGGTVVCTATLEPECSSNIDDAEAEVCNGLDDDCDGLGDEDFAWQTLAVGDPCDGTGACGDGEVECLPSGLGATCSTNADGSQNEDADEVCNGLDDDCDGDEDEQLGYDDSDCKKDGVCGPSNTVATCDGAQGWLCSYSSPSYSGDDELGWCDSLDNDCDGLIDEDYPDKGQPCDGGDADECESGTWTCLGAGSPSGGGGGEPLCEESVSFEELCNGEDDDCDDEIDEGPPDDCTLYWLDEDEDGRGNAHVAPQCLCGPEGPWTAQNDEDCDDGAKWIYEGAPELCDAFGDDEDCDGAVNEPDAEGCEVYLRDEDGDTFGLLEDSLCLCEAGDVEFYTWPYWEDDVYDCNDLDPEINPWADEVCDDVDHDCDGKIYKQNAIGCEKWWKDLDGDGWGAGQPACLCAPVGKYTSQMPGDCCNKDPHAHPDQGGFFTAENQCGSFDYDCDEQEEIQYDGEGICQCDSNGGYCDGDEPECGYEPGWYTSGLGQIPDCGETGYFLDDCNLIFQPGQNPSCSPVYNFNKAQPCR